ncbi:MAG: DUF108 domain-containing protein [Rhodospirillaceae bacterium]|nr:DUF108 domain-containing protein [Rhodospirillaceae bacterium]
MTGTGKPAIYVGVIGYGYIGRYIVKRISQSGGRFQTAFVYNRSADALADVDQALRLDDLRQVETHNPDLIVECAHPSISARYGEGFLENCDYMPLSVTALADDALRERLATTAAAHGTRLVVPAGALLGGDELLMRRVDWNRVRITFRKHPDNLDFSESSFDPADIEGETIVYEGSVRGIAKLYPRNVNTMVTCALVSTGLDACEARLIADPALNRAVAEVEAWDRSGGMLRTEKRQPAVGVSGSEMLHSTWYSILRAAGVPRGSIDLV